MSSFDTNFIGGTINLNNGSGTGGGVINMDGGSINGDISLTGDLTGVAASFSSITNTSGVVNPGNSTLVSGTKPVEYVSYRSPITNFLALASTSIFTVPANFMFIVDEIDFPSSINNVAFGSPTIEVGNTTTSNAYLSATQISCNGVGEIMKNVVSENGILSGTVINFTVTSASTASAETGVVILKGYLVPTN